MQCSYSKFLLIWNHHCYCTCTFVVFVITFLYAQVRFCEYFCYLCEYICLPYSTVKWCCLQWMQPNAWLTLGCSMQYHFMSTFLYARVRFCEYVCHICEYSCHSTPWQSGAACNGYSLMLGWHLMAVASSTTLP